LLLLLAILRHLRVLFESRFVDAICGRTALRRVSWGKLAQDAAATEIMKDILDLSLAEF
jgi:hypothetical protein